MTNKSGVDNHTQKTLEEKAEDILINTIHIIKVDNSVSVDYSQAIEKIKQALVEAEKIGMEKGRKLAQKKSI